MTKMVYIEGGYIQLESVGVHDIENVSLTKFCDMSHLSDSQIAWMIQTLDSSFMRHISLYHEMRLITHLT